MSTEKTNAAQTVERQVSWELVCKATQMVLQPIEILLSTLGVRQEIEAGRDGRRRKLFYLSLPADHPMVTLGEDGNPVVAPPILEAIEDRPYYCEHAFDGWPTVETMRMGADFRHGIARDAENRMQAELAENKAEMDRINAEAADRKKKLDQDFQDERNLWIATNGSPLLKRTLAEGINCMDTYLSERIAKDYPGWVFADGVDTDPASSPTAEDLEMLYAARRTAPDAEMVRADVPDDEDGKHVARAYLHGRMMLYTGDAQR